MDILTRANWPMHSPASSFCQSFLPIFGWSLVIHIIGILWIGTQKEVCVKDYFLMSPMLISSASTSKALSKFHGPPINTFLFSPSVANLNKNTLSPILSIFTYITVLHACCIAAFKPSLLTPLVSMTFPTKQFAAIFPPIFFILPISVTVSSYSSFKKMVWHFLINSFVSISPWI